MSPYDRTSAFLEAVEGGDVESVAALLNIGGVDYGVKNVHGMGVVHIVAQNGSADIMRLFLSSSNFDFNEIRARSEASKPGWTALHYARDVQTLRLLLGDVRGRVNVGVRDARGFTALAIAVRNKDIERVKLFLADGRIDVNIGAHDTGYNALHIAICGGYLEAVKLLIAYKRTDINAARTDSGWTALHHAPASDGRTDILKVLIENAGVNVNARSKTGVTPLRIAACKGYAESVKILLADRRVDVNIGSTGNGFNALHIAVQGRPH